MASLNEIKKVLIASGVKAYAIEETTLDGQAALHVAFEDLSSDAFNKTSAHFKSQMNVDETDKGVLFLAA